jgi:hypothetical protein
MTKVNQMSAKELEIEIERLNKYIVESIHTAEEHMEILDKKIEYQRYLRQKNFDFLDSIKMMPDD